MRIKMLTTSAGPDGCRENGREYNVADNEAKELIEGGYAKLVREPFGEQSSRPGKRKRRQRVENAAQQPADNAALLGAGKPRTDGAE